MKRLLLLLLFFTSSIFAQPLDSNINGLSVHRPASLYDGVSGGVVVTRDASALTGGPLGNVNAALVSSCTIGSGVVPYEWCNLNILTNFATAASNVASYSQGNKMSTGPTWASVSEVADTVGAGGISVGIEIDNWTTGADDGQRLGALVAVGDAKSIRGLPGGGVAQASTGVLIGATNTTPWARWTNGALISAYTSAGLVLQGPATRGLFVQGPHVVAVDLGSTSGQTSIRLPIGGRVAFDQWDAYGVRLDPNTQEFVFDHYGDVLMRLTPGGHLYIKGLLHQQSGASMQAPMVKAVKPKKRAN